MKYILFSIKVNLMIKIKKKLIFRCSEVHLNVNNLKHFYSKLYGSKWFFARKYFITILDCLLYLALMYLPGQLTTVVKFVICRRRKTKIIKPRKSSKSQSRLKKIIFFHGHGQWNLCEGLLSSFGTFQFLKW